MHPATIHRAAYLVTPGVGGIFSVFVSLRAALAVHGIDLRWVGASLDPDALRADPAFAPFLDQGHLVDARQRDQTACGKALLDTLLRQQFDLVFANVLTSAAEMSVLAYLPPAVRRVMIVHNITPGTYSAARAVAPFADVAVGVCPRIHEHLVKRLGFPAARAFSVPNAVDLAPFAAQTRIDFQTPLRLLSLGRIVDTDKGVFWLPEILCHLQDLPVQLTVAGDGPDLPALKQRCADLGERIHFAGRIAAAKVPALVAAHHVFLMTSRFEGLPYTLIETMAGGCVPVASRIRGVTDFVIREGVSGLLVPMGNTRAFAHAVRRLAGDAALHQSLSAAARGDVQDRFTVTRMTEAYEPILDLLGSATHVTASHHEEPFELLKIGGKWRRLVPKGVKNVLRKYL